MTIGSCRSKLNVLIFQKQLKLTKLEISCSNEKILLCLIFSVLHVIDCKYEQTKKAILVSVGYRPLGLKKFTVSIRSVHKLLINFCLFVNFRCFVKVLIFLNIPNLHKTYFFCCFNFLQNYAVTTLTVVGCGSPGLRITKSGGIRQKFQPYKVQQRFLCKFYVK